MPSPEPAVPHHFQTSLFKDGGLRDDGFKDADPRDGVSPDRAISDGIDGRKRNPKVIPIPMLPPLRQGQRKGGASTGNARGVGRKADSSQQSLNFSDADYGDQGFDAKVEAVIYCDAPVATPTHRMMSAVADTAWIAIGLGVFSMTFFVGTKDLTGAMSFERPNVLILAAGVALIAQFYRTLWMLAKGDSPGMRFARLRLVNFDGREPTRKQRAIRQAASVLSVCAMGAGLLWALVDEENLTWHDHISKTFPTPG